MNTPTEPSSCPYSAGARIGDKYVLERLIGTGGMCTVWAATDVGLDRKVAIKFLRSDLPPRESDRLLREARAAARVGHPAIIRVFDYGETDADHPFIVMELLQGASLAESLYRNGPFSAVAACRLLIPIIDGLAACHDGGIVHRDLKPENVFLVREGGRQQPKLLDFGIAKLRTRDPKPRLTLNGAVLGSPAYMAPEQARGQSDVDHRADIWAACVLLYEAVTGSTPFRGDNYNAILRSIIEEDVQPLQERGGGEAALWAILSRGFAKNRDRRYQSIRELGEALAGFLVARGVRLDISGVPLARTFGSELMPAEPKPEVPRCIPKTGARASNVRTLTLPRQTSDLARGWARAVVATRRAAQSRQPKALFMRFLAMLVGGLFALVVPTTVVESSIAARFSAERMRRVAADSARMLAHAAGARWERSPGGPDSIRSTRPEPRLPPLEVSDAPEVSAASVAPADVLGAAPPSVRSSARASSRRKVARHSDARSSSASAPADPSAPAGPADSRLDAQDKVRALGLKTPYP